MLLRWCTHSSYEKVWTQLRWSESIVLHSVKCQTKQSLMRLLCISKLKHTVLIATGVVCVKVWEWELKCQDTHSFVLPAIHSDTVAIIYPPLLLNWWL